MEREKSATTTQRLHDRYWTRLPDGEVRLVASECTQCHLCYLPAITTCTGCGGRSFCDKPLSGTGQLYSHTTVHNAGGIWPAEYTIAYVDYPERVRVCGHLRAPDAAMVRLDMPVGVEEATLYVDAAGTRFNCFRFYIGEDVR